ncbi:hypothetical protein DRJ48_05420, partial [Candidatus Woesearchaeota archaeon]
MDSSALEGIGLSNGEIRVFTVLLELGESKAGKLIEKSRLQSSSVYNALNSLISKGLVSYVKRGNVKFYRAAEPETIIEYIDMKKKAFLKLLTEIRARQQHSVNEIAELYKSYRGVKMMLIKMLNNSKPGDVMKIFSAGPDAYELARGRVFKEIKELIIKKGIK